MTASTPPSTPPDPSVDAGAVAPDEQPSPELIALAEHHGIATRYWSFFGNEVVVPAATLRAVLAAMHVDASDGALAGSLAEALDAPWRALVPASTVVRPGVGAVVVQVTDGYDVTVRVDLEDGGTRELAIAEQSPTSREVDGVVRWRVEIAVPADVPWGWHRVVVTEQRAGGGELGRTASGVLAVTPERLPDPPVREGDRGWGLMSQLYSVRSHTSWGMGDFADAGDLAAVAGGRGADFLLLNPIHAAEVTVPIEPSPYLPATRRFLAPLYLRPEDIREVAYLDAAGAAAVADAHASVCALNEDAVRIDRDAVWEAKRSALEVIFAAPRSAGREADLAHFVAREGQALADFALWCAIEEHYAADPAPRPESAWDITSPLVAQLREQLADRVDFHTWLQWIAEEQVEAAQRAATASGMGIGIMHDLAVGVHKRGSDAWSLAPMYANGITVGAPPDMYNQQGQDWSQPPWLPGALAEAGYAPLRDMVRTLLRHAGALRVDHIIGLFRLWWIPAGLGPAAGTYVRYDHEAMIGVLALEAARAGAVVVGEDLGNVEPWVRDYLSERGILGTSVLWFEQEGDKPLPPERYRRALLATVNTHDLPPTAGYLADEHVALRARLELLTQPVDDALAEAHAEREHVMAALRERGLIGQSPTEEEIIAALHVFLAAAPSLLLGVALVDAVGERRVQNQPGTDKEYPNWQVPLAGADGRAVFIEDLAALPRFVALTDAVDRAVHP